jgi:membrane-bound lytic murein transglycosylase D
MHFVKIKRVTPKGGQWMPYFLLLVLFASCSTRQLQRPSATINDFKQETKDTAMAEVISTNGEYRNQNFLNPVMNKNVNFWLKYFTTRGRDTLQRHFVRGQRYRKDIEGIFKEHGLPKELFYVGLIESGYNLSARSRANAVGPWQFIKDTGRRYGLNINHVLDERRNIIKSTNAAAEFFSDLYNIFGSWELALSAYNAGEYGIIRRIRKAGTRDYYELCEKKAIPRETRNYVPKVLAVKTIAENPDRYGFVLNTPTTYLEDLKTVSVEGSTTLRNLARKLRINVNTLKKHNPELISYRTPNYVKDDFEVLVPRDVSANTISFKHYRFPQSQKKSNRYTVKRGDNLTQIAKRNGLSLEELKSINQLRSNTVYVGQKLNIKITAETPTPRKSKTYKVKRGDHLNKIARRFNTTYKNLKKLNKMSSNRIYPGQTIKVPDVEHLTYKVKVGDHLHKIARNFKTNIRTIKKLNGLRSSRIYPGQKLIVSIR